jgi:hypothetical protein
MTSRKTPFELIYASRMSPTRWLRTAFSALDQGAAAVLCAQHWQRAQPVPVPVRVEIRRHS